jgi:undecaprenyl-diphosphatase
MKKFIAILLVLVPVSLSSQNIDVDILKAIHSPEPLPSDDFFRFMSDANFYVYVGTPVTMAVVGLARKDNELLRDAAAMAAGTAIAYGVALGFKYTVKRDRPFVAYPDEFTDKTGHDSAERSIMKSRLPG